MDDSEDDLGVHPINLPSPEQAKEHYVHEPPLGENSISSTENQDDPLEGPSGLQHATATVGLETQSNAYTDATITADSDDSQARNKKDRLAFTLSPAKKRKTRRIY